MSRYLTNFAVMKTILVIGAGRSSSALINYLLNHAEQEQWKVRVGDMDVKLAQQKTNGHAHATAFYFNIEDSAQREQEIASADVVISMLPAFMHGAVAKDCVRLKKHLVTASYVSDEMKALHEEAVNNDVLLLNEIGLDPGIDHMSAMEIIHKIEAQGGKLTAFYSYCGGLVAPESNTNPWGYKFSWNPRNVILAGQGTAQYIENGKLRYLPYSRLFASHSTINVKGHGAFDAYANRDSLSYRSVYGIENIPTMLRGTLRYPGYCKAWQLLVTIGLTDDSFKIQDANLLTYAEFIESLLPLGDGALQERIADLCHIGIDDPALQKLQWTGLLSNDRIPLEHASPAQIVQELLERKWKLEAADKDMVVMQHIFEYEMQERKQVLRSSLVVIGKNQTETAMAATVGLPAAIAVRLLINNKISKRGVVVPVDIEIYEPVLRELREYDIVFEEETSC
jgi:saccharopine dehydrogenase-like NADP-dependent oxidoreductase